MKLRFTIRDLLWLTLVVAMAVGWWLDRARLSSKLEVIHERLDDIVAHYGFPPASAKAHDFLMQRIYEMPDRDRETGYRR